MNYIVFDLEWNQSPNGKEDSVDHLPFEIIEIGAVKLDEGFCQVGEFHKLIRPQVYKKLHFKISEVTHMDMRKLCQEGQRFEDVIREFVEWCGEEEYCFCTWSEKRGPDRAPEEYGLLWPGYTFSPPSFVLRHTEAVLLPVWGRKE